ncbi:hypothetical protein [Deinococcus cellulosilyticus]|uniref:Uncharacterized protein n=1 Tax=Deinococcus cellulosilyticus (strain DSM 18568 / NBRC 106333 / KACC 11606 / 5516J-15) TaxID=1223518 RepID=A0A511N0K5_DEIC1|nr:hypothetical protein [Deinococcus cellulosilyticus]GEM46374.1 hypothetical protein DC3_20090 [Deinococcus cellulosilyticus NBRC 106333 = KACC 11606]
MTQKPSLQKDWRRFAVVPEGIQQFALNGWFATWPDLHLLAVVCRHGRLEVLEFCWQGEVFRVQVQEDEIWLFCQNPRCSRVQQQVLQHLLNNAKSGVWTAPAPQRSRVQARSV